LDAALQKELGESKNVFTFSSKFVPISMQIEAPKQLDLKPKDKIEVFWTDDGYIWMEMK